MRKRDCIVFLFFVFLFFAASLRAGEVCGRPPIGSAVENPPSVESADGKLQLDLFYRTFVDRYRQTRYCYVTGDQLESPTLRVHPGDDVVLTLTNQLPHATGMQHPHAPGCTTGAMSATSTNLHFHGLDLPPSCHQDETLRTLIQPNDPPFEYRFKIPLSQPPGLYWYHPHPHGFTEPQVLGGASGALIVEGIEQMKPQVAGLPERVLVLRDQNASGVKDDDDNNEQGKDLSINFVQVLFPLFRPAAMRVRPNERQFWRVLNASADTYFDLQVRFGATIQDIHDPQEIELIAMDGSAVGGDAKRTHVLVGPGARAEFIMTTPPAGIWGQLVTLNYERGPDGEANPYRTLANISAAGDVPGISTMPAAAPQQVAFHGLADLKPARGRRLYFSEQRKDPKTIEYFITEEGSKPKVFDMNFKRPDITAAHGTVEDWVIENRAQEAHVFHIHQLHFQLLERDGHEAVEPIIRDTIDLPYWDGKGPYPSVKLRMDFRSPEIVGMFVYHCHILEHEDGGMMGSIRVK
jgi:FtsP/CotA-like multicopper oxidase with cupredoxin domain